MATPLRLRADSTEARARDEYEQGKRAFESGRYDEALRLFRDAHALSKAPGLLYNEGATQERLGHPHEAAEALRAYLRDAPASPQTADIEGRIRGLEEAQRLLDAERMRTQPLALQDLHIDLHRERRKMAIGLGVGLGVLVAGLAVGFGLGYGLEHSPAHSTLGTHPGTP